MGGSLVIETKYYAVYARIIAGQGDGPLIWIDSHGHIHVGGGDPGPNKERIQAAVKQIEAGVGAIQHVFASLGAPK